MGQRRQVSLQCRCEEATVADLPVKDRKGLLGSYHHSSLEHAVLLDWIWSCKLDVLQVGHLRGSSQKNELSEVERIQCE